MATTGAPACLISSKVLEAIGMTQTGKQNRPGLLWVLDISRR